jgi:hypothetical protein
MSQVEQVAEEALKGGERGRGASSRRTARNEKKELAPKDKKGCGRVQAACGAAGTHGAAAQVCVVNGVLGLVVV